MKYEAPSGALGYKIYKKIMEVFNMIEVKNGDFLVTDNSLKSLYFYQSNEDSYNEFGKKTKCNFYTVRIKGKPKKYRTRNDNNELIYTYFNIFKSPDFNFIDFNYETGEVIEIRLLEALQPESCATGMFLEIKFVDFNDNTYYKREFININSFNGTQEKRLQYYKEFFDKYCKNYVDLVYSKGFEIPKVDILSVAYKELLSSSETIFNHCDHLHKDVAVRIFGKINNFSLFEKDRYMRLFSAFNKPRYLKYLNNVNLNNKYKNQISKIYEVVKSNTDIVYLYKNTSHHTDKMQIFNEKLNDFISLNEARFK